MRRSFAYGHAIYSDESEEFEPWRWSDTNELCPSDFRRACKRCGELPTSEGYDACLGKLENVESACCGHGVKEPILILETMKSEKELIEQAKALCEKFVNKVETGRARSVETHADCKAFLDDLKSYESEIKKVFAELKSSREILDS